MSVTQYIGARYVPLFADPLTWDITKAYEALTIVYYQGNSFTSRQAVPAGIDITNTDYWALTGNYNAQIEQYRAEVQTYDNRITANTTSNTAQDAQLAGTTSSGLKTLIDTNTASNTSQDAQLAGTSTSGLKTLIESETAARSAADTALEGDITDLETILTGFSTSNQVKSYVDAEIAEATTTPDMVVIGDSFTSSYYVQDSNLWYHAVAKALGCTPHNYSQRGAGFLNASTQDSSTFMTLLDDAAEDSSFDNANVKWLFVYGGLNDIEHANATQAFSTYFNNFCNAVVSNFPNAQLVVCGINAWQDGFSFYSVPGSSTGQKNGQIYYEQTMKQQTGFLNARGIFISMCGALGFNSSWYDSSNNHPNASGHKALASWILSAMFGSGLVRSVTGDVMAYDTSITTKGNITLHIGPGRVDYRIWIASQQDSQSVMDSLGFLKDNAIDTRGTSLVAMVGNDRTLGWLGAHNNNYASISVTGQGFGQGFRNW